ncbi:MAG: TVP38/TMEM64 family protein [Verrucomicrobiales bacterium]
MSETDSLKRASRWIKPVALLALAVALLFGLSRIDLAPALRWVQDQGVWAPIIFCVLYVGCTVVMIPGSLLTLGAGAIFGPLWAMIYVTAGANIGANTAFFLGRFVARPWVERKIAGNSRVELIGEAVAREGWKTVGLLRLSPVFPFALLNYILAVTRVSWHDYALASLIGMLPGTFLYVYLGHALGAAVLSSSAHEQTTAERVALWVGLAASVAVTVFITRLARRALSARLNGAP